MNKGRVRSSDLESEISRSVARIVLRLLPRIPRTDWRNNIIPFPAIYKKVGYVMKLDRKTTGNILCLLTSSGCIEAVRFHGVVLRNAPFAETKAQNGSPVLCSTG